MAYLSGRRIEDHEDVHRIIGERLHDVSIRAPFRMHLQDECPILIIREHLGDRLQLLVVPAQNERSLKRAVDRKVETLEVEVAAHDLARDLLQERGRFRWVHQRDP